MPMKLEVVFKNMAQIINKKSIIIGVVLVILAAAGGVIYLKRGESSGNQLISPEEAKAKIIDYIHENIPDTEIVVNEVKEDSGLYKITMELGGQEFISYISRDGKLLFPQAINLEEEAQGETSEEPPQSSVPDVKLFVMSYCPYGLQAEKALLPAWELLKEKAEIGIYFVDYIMHEKKEIDENLRSYCIQKEEPEKFISYLKCFAADGDYEGCLEEAGINQERLTSCVEETDRAFGVTQNYNDQSSWLNGQYPKFQVHADLNDKYEVSGSPTLVINDVIVNVASRSPEGFKAAICEAFTSQPEECSQELSEETASPGLGFGTGGSSGTCE
jgi:hypothetical protein